MADVVGGRQIGGHLDGVVDGFGPRRPVADHTHALDAQQHRAAHRFGVERLVQREQD